MHRPPITTRSRAHTTARTSARAGSAAFGALLCVSVAIATPPPLAAQGLGSLIKKKAAEAVKGPDKPADKPADKSQQSVAHDGCPISDDSMDRFLKGLETERAERAALKADLSRVKTNDQYQACYLQVMQSPEGMKFAERISSASSITNAGQRQSALEKLQADITQLIQSRCGKEPSEVFNTRNARMTAAERAGAKAADMDESCYNLLKERIVPFCGLPEKQQQLATKDGIKVPGAMKTMFYVYTAAEARAMAPRCAALVSALNAIESVNVPERPGP